MSYLVCHMEKYHKTDICHIEDENERDENYIGSNNCIDHTRTKNNYRLLIRNSSYTDFINARISELNLSKSPRKDAVLMASFVVGSDRDFFKNLNEEQQNLFFRDCTNFFVKRYGRNNIISAVVHNDETTPHMHLNLIPVKDNRLCAKELLNRNELSRLQTDFHEQVGKLWKLKRGKEGSTESHLSTAEFKAKCLLDDAVAKSTEMIMNANEKLENIEQAVQKADEQFNDTLKEISIAKKERDKVVQERNEEIDFTKSLEDAKNGKFAHTPKGLKNQIIALTTENEDLTKRLNKAMSETLEYAKKAETIEKEKENDSHYAMVGKALARTNSSEYKRIVYGKPRTMVNFLETVISMFTPEVTSRSNRLEEIKKEIEDEKERQEKISNYYNVK